MIIDEDADRAFRVVNGILWNHRQRRLTVQDIQELSALPYTEVLCGLFLLLRLKKISQRKPGVSREKDN
jgi:hypothetical protein